LRGGLIAKDGQVLGDAEGTFVTSAPHRARSRATTS
jgi:hypothetical protein